MKFYPFFMAWRYLLARKRYNVINIVSLIAMLAVLVVSMAIVAVLSIFNGYETMMLGNLSKADPSLKIVPEVGQTFSTDSLDWQAVTQLTGVTHYAFTLESKGIVSVDGLQQMAYLKGVQQESAVTDHLASYEVEGRIGWYTGQLNLGIQLSTDLMAPAQGGDTLVLTVPKRKGMINPIMPITSFKRSRGMVASVLSFANQQYDRTIFMPLGELQRLLQYSDDRVGAMELWLADDAASPRIERQLEHLLPDSFDVLNRVEQHPDIMKMVAIEKWISFFLLFFILILSAYNITASVSMLLIEKEHDRTILMALGAKASELRTLFRVQGSMIALFGALLGVLLGVLICWSQQRFGWLTISSMGVMMPYPVEVRWADLLAVLIAVSLTSILSVLYPVRVMSKKKNK